MTSTNPRTLSRLCDVHQPSDFVTSLSRPPTLTSLSRLCHVHQPRDFVTSLSRPPTLGLCHVFVTSTNPRTLSRLCDVHQPSDFVTSLSRPPTLGLCHVFVTSTNPATAAASSASPALSAPRQTGGSCSFLTATLDPDPALKPSGSFL